ncbi:hypothetical protein HanPI659440_Chr08g0282641 [Helianthus annuus]|nr:hypothetical protein HanPI659440_Chr08g0282641 [Helianthus annuus]
MVFGCTVATAMMDEKCLTKEGYAANHPAGRIGKSLIFKVNFSSLLSKFGFNLAQIKEASFF